eukprot:TRINITY_DN846_c0_g1_i1.p1 TRINITY_DN846_c0_g1~~TRINITY_DN846_c0_g1_i1.p1  ORF type:complete len:374 (-),score=124.26 TRINITY_DN846_c0_g1_i1:121-1242(-)
MSFRILVAACILASLFVVSFATERDYYEVLGVSKTSNPSQIKKAYRKLSLETHPDKAGNSPEVLKKFQEISEAYQVLSDPEKKEVYDKYGHEGLKQQQGGGSGFNDPFDIFSQFANGFGSFFGGGRQESQEEKRGADIEMDLQVSLKDLYLGKTFSVHVTNQHLCPKCGGTGARSESDIHKCSACQGRGVRTQVRQLAPGFVQQFQSTCEVCGGAGKTIKHKCSKCDGHKVMTGSKTLSVVVEPGVPDGHKIVLENEGDEHPDMQAGHVIFRVVTAPHAQFRRASDDLHVEFHISLLEALVGVDKTLTHLDGRSIPVKKEGITRPDEIMRIANEGMPIHGRSSRRGTLYVKFIIDFPQSLTTQQKEEFAKILP